MSGNGYAVQGNNFGIGVFGTDNEIVDNVAVGNANGIILFLSGIRNFVGRNIVVGNPPVQISVNNPGTTGVDLRNDIPGENTIIDNVCVTVVNAVCSIFDGTVARR